MADLSGIIGAVFNIASQAANDTVGEAGAAGGAAMAGFLGIFAVMWILIMLFYLAIIMIILAFFVIWIIMLVDCIRRTDFKGENDRLLWVLILILGGWIGAIIYYFTVMRKR